MASPTARRKHGLRTPRKTDRADSSCLGREGYEIVEGTGWRISRFLDSGVSTYVAVIEKKQGENET
jgi:hypothetical protein